MAVAAARFPAQRAPPVLLAPPAQREAQPARLVPPAREVVRPDPQGQRAQLEPMALMVLQAQPVLRDGMVPPVRQEQTPRFQVRLVLQVRLALRAQLVPWLAQPGPLDLPVLTALMALRVQQGQTLPLPVLPAQPAPREPPAPLLALRVRRAQQAQLLPPQDQRVQQDQREP